MSGTRLLDQVRDLLRFKHYSLRTEEAYTDWSKRVIFFHDKRYPREMRKRHVNVRYACVEWLLVGKRYRLLLTDDRRLASLVGVG